MRIAHVIMVKYEGGSVAPVEVTTSEEYAVQRCQLLSSQYGHNRYYHKALPLDVGIVDPYAVTFEPFEMIWRAKGLAPLDDQEPGTGESHQPEVYPDRWVWPLIWADSPESAIAKAKKLAIAIIGQEENL